MKRNQQNNNVKEQRFLVNLQEMAFAKVVEQYVNFSEMKENLNQLLPLVNPAFIYLRESYIAVL